MNPDIVVPELTELELSRLPLFPLNRAVLLPGVDMPLHIFEPRYRAMVRAVLESGGAMGVAMLREQTLSAALAERPPIRAVAGAGRIIRHVELPDGRFMILVRGILRIEVERELDSTEPFRRFAVRPVRDEAMHEAQGAQAMLAMQDCLRQLAPVMNEGGAALLDAAAHAKDAGQLADVLAGALVEDALERQTLLETPRASERVPRVVSAMAGLLLSVPGVTVHDGLQN